MTDDNAGQTPEKKQVQAANVTQMRLLRASERPDDALIELTTAKGTDYFVLPGKALPDLVQKLTKFQQGGGTDSSSQ